MISSQWYIAFPCIRNSELKMKADTFEQNLHTKVDSLIAVLGRIYNCSSDEVSPTSVNTNITRTINVDDPELIQAAGTSDLQRVFALLYCDEIDPNIKNDAGITPLLQAILDKQENLSIVELLIDRGADVNAVTSDGLTSLMIASIKGYKNIVLKLLKAGADMRKKDMFGYTAEALATRLGHYEIKDILEDNSKK